MAYNIRANSNLFIVIAVIVSFLLNYETNCLGLLVGAFAPFISPRSNVLCRYVSPSKLKSISANDVENKQILQSCNSENELTTAIIRTNRRRELLLQTQRDVISLSLVQLLFGQTSAYAQQDLTENIPRKTIVMTGANSGIGFEACKRLINRGHTIILACRTRAKAQDTINRIQQDTSFLNKGKLVPAECDLADMVSIQKFVHELSSTDTTIDTICLNAGIARNTAATDCARTKDGFELTVGVNHFGHFYLNHLLVPMLAKDGRIVVTASSVHDPESPGGAQGESATIGDLRGLQQFGRACEMLDGNPFNADKAYKDSKLCNVLFTRELQRRLDSNTATKQISVNCFSPGLIVGTGLFRDQNPIFTKLFDIAATNLLKVGESPEWGGACLEYMTTISTKGLYYNSDPGSSKYGDDAFGREFIPMKVSKEGQDDVKAKLLWELSAKALGITA